MLEVKSTRGAQRAATSDHTTAGDLNASEAPVLEPPPEEPDWEGEGELPELVGLPLVELENTARYLISKKASL